MTLEIVVCPADVAYAGKTLRHHLRVLGGQVEEVLFAVDLKPPAGGRFAEGWGDALPALEELLADLTRSVPSARIVSAEGERSQLERLGRHFFGGSPIPAKDCRGSAFEVYWLAFDAPTHDYILRHMDGDMLFGGGSQTWVSEAV